MVCKIGIKIGQVEINYEGEEVFFKEELPKIIAEVSHLVKNKEPIENPFTETTVTLNDKKTNGTKNLDLSVATIAAKIQQKTGPDLVLAAAAYLTYVEKIESFSRDQIWEKMKTAPSLNKASFNNNLTKYIRQLVSSQQLTQNSAGRYALSANSLARLEHLLVN
jgi:hypothetical protein